MIFSSAPGVDDDEDEDDGDVETPAYLYDLAPSTLAPSLKSVGSIEYISKFFEDIVSVCHRRSLDPLHQSESAFLPLDVMQEFQIAELPGVRECLEFLLRDIDHVNRPSVLLRCSVPNSLQPGINFVSIRSRQRGLFDEKDVVDELLRVETTRFGEDGVITNQRQQELFFARTRAHLEQTLDALHQESLDLKASIEKAKKARRKNTSSSSEEDDSQ